MEHLKFNGLQKHSKIDVLIIGAGPTGLLAALWLAKYGVSFRIIDKLGTRALNGRADGMQVRTHEIWDSFGLSEIITKHATSTQEFVVWAPRDGKNLERVARDVTIGHDVSSRTSNMIHQGHWEAILIDAIKKNGGPSVERGTVPFDLTIDKDATHSPSTFPVKVHIRRLQLSELEPWGVHAHTKDGQGNYQTERGSITTETVIEGESEITPRIDGNPGTTEIIHAKYILGSEGGKSWTRRAIGAKFEGTSKDDEWGVIDIWPLTDFPDVRKLVQVVSGHGTVLMVPREQGLVRLYVQLEVGDVVRSPDEANDPAVAQQLMVKINTIMAPYHIDYRYCDWLTIYKVGQRISSQYSEGSRIFLAGDACHTHTPKGGQGMNVSMQDAYNLGWKIAGVVQGQLDPAVLSTYETERRPIAEQLIAFDQDLDAALGGKVMPTKEILQRTNANGRVFQTGVGVRYSPSVLVSQTRPDLAPGLTIGSRFPNCTVYDQSTGTPTESQRLLRSTGTWYLLVFAGDPSPTAQLSRVNAFGEQLARRVLPQFVSVRPDAPALRPLLFHATNIARVESRAFHRTFFPYDEVKGHDYHTIFADVPAVNEHRGDYAHQVYKVDPERGCVVVVRPDQIVGWIGEVGDIDGLLAYLDGFMRRL